MFCYDTSTKVEFKKIRISCYNSLSWDKASREIELSDHSFHLPKQKQIKAER